MKNNSASVDTAIEILKELKIIKGYSCISCLNVLKVHKDNSKSNGVRYYCFFCKKYSEIRNFTPFKEYQIKIIDILRIILLFSESKNNDTILLETNYSKTLVSKILNLIRIK